MGLLIEMSDFIRWVIFFILAVPAVVGIVLNALWFTDAAARQTLRGASSLPAPSSPACVVLWPWWSVLHPIPPCLPGCPSCSTRVFQSTSGLGYSVTVSPKAKKATKPYVKTSCGGKSQ